MEYTILILLLPLASFLVLGLAGMKMRPAAAGAVGTAVLAVVALLSYWTAFEYFSAGRDAAGVFPTQIPWNAVWLPIGGALHIDLGILLDPISVMMLVVISTVSLMVHIYSLGYMKGERGFQRYYAFLSLFTMSMIGLVVATNIFQMYLFWELVGVSSYLLVGFYYTKKEAVAASKKAFIVTRFADLGFLIGILIYGYYAGTFSFTPETHALVAAGAMIPLALGLMFVGGAGKSAMFPLHIWLPKAHPVAPAPASALLSGILTKSGIFGVIVVSANIFRASTAWGNMLLVLGLITMLGGAVLAVFSINLKRTLACSSMSQIGFILTGIAMGCLLGEENALAARGALLYMVNHSLFKLVLFMAAGVVYMNLHKLNLNDVRGFGRKKPILHFAFLMGAVGLMGVPGFSGYVSKTLIHEGILEYAELLAEEGMGALALLYRGAEWIYLFSGGLTGAYMIKLYICLFWEKHPTQQIAYEAKKPYMGKLSALALLLSAAIVPALGLTPNLTMDKIADIAGGFLNAAAPAHAVHYFSLTNIKGACISLAIGLIVYLLFIRTKLMKKENGMREYIDLWPSWLDIEDRIYRPAIGGLLELGGRFAGLGSETTLETYVYRPMIRALTLFFAAVFGFLGGLTDFVADLIARKVLSARRKKLENRVGNAVTRAVGGVFDGMVEGLNQTVLRGHRIEHHAMARISAAWDGAMDAISQMSHTMSYGLLLFGLGLCVTLLYLMFY